MKDNVPTFFVLPSQANGNILWHESLKNRVNTSARNATITLSRAMIFILSGGKGTYSRFYQQQCFTLLPNNIYSTVSHSS